jgi:hypothetical protein
MYRIHFAGRAERAFRKLSPEVQRRLDPAILALADDPRPPGCLKLPSQTQGVSYGPVRGAVFGVVLHRGKAVFYDCLYRAQMTSTERAALPQPTERRLNFRPRNAGQTRQV